MIGDLQIYQINSKSRQNPATESNSDFTYKIELPPGSNFNKITMLSASVPKSYYNVPAAAYFTLSEDGFTAAISLTPANYTRRAFGTRLQDALNNNSPLSFVYSVSYDNAINSGDTGKWTISVSGNSGIQPAFIFEQGNRMLELMGFSEYSSGVLDLTKEFSADQITSENCPILQAEQTLYIRSNICQNYQNNILGTIFINVGDFSNAVFNCPDVLGYARNFAGTPSNVYWFKLTDEDSNIIDTNGVNVNFIIALFREVDIYALLLAQLKLAAGNALANN
jgi:hypothetical protein